MPVEDATLPTRNHQPLILIRGFGGLDVEEERSKAYQGFNQGTVYPQKRGENYIYEGLILRFLKSDWEYRDATNVVGFYSKEINFVLQDKPEILKEISDSFFCGHKVVIDPGMAAALLMSREDSLKSLWVFRYYDLGDRRITAYGEALVRLIDFIRALCTMRGQLAPKVNIIAHSMGGLIVREAIQATYPNGGRGAPSFINKVITLGTPHQGISFQVLKNWLAIEARDELEHFNVAWQASERNCRAFLNVGKHFPLARLLAVVGTNYRTYGTTASSSLNRLFSVPNEYGTNYNRSDGLVQQSYAQIPGAPRTFVHKCHGGADSLVTSRETFEIATRFLFGDVHVMLNLAKAQVLRGKDLVGRSEFFFGVSVKPRGVDFELFHQSAEAENCYGPFHEEDFTDDEPAFGWAGPDRLIWEGWLDTTAIKRQDASGNREIVVRLDVYVGERDLLGLGFSDNVIFRKQYYVRAQLAEDLKLFQHSSEQFRRGDEGTEMIHENGRWNLHVKGTGFEGVMQLAFKEIPLVG